MCCRRSKAARRLHLFTHIHHTRCASTISINPTQRHAHIEIEGHPCGGLVAEPFWAAAHSAFFRDIAGRWTRGLPSSDGARTPSHCPAKNHRMIDRLTKRECANTLIRQAGAAWSDRLVWRPPEWGLSERTRRTGTGRRQAAAAGAHGSHVVGLQICGRDAAQRDGHRRRRVRDI